MVKITMKKEMKGTMMKTMKKITMRTIMIAISLMMMMMTKKVRESNPFLKTRKSLKMMSSKNLQSFCQPIPRSRKK
jgi:hypothetical protein